MRDIGRIVANVVQAMSRAMAPGMTTAELDALGESLLAREGAVSAPRSCYDFPGATCISVNEEIAHGIPGARVLAEGDLVNIDVSASKNGFFADTGASFRLGPVAPSVARLLADGEKAARIGVAVPVALGSSLGALGPGLSPVVCPHPDAWCPGVGAAYQRFPQVSDEEVTRLVSETAQTLPG